MRLSKHATGIVSLTILAATLILEMLPFGAVLIFAPGPDESIKQTFAYFSLIPFGYANFFPLLTAILSVASAIFLTIALIKKVNITHLQKAIVISTASAFILSIMPGLIFGTAYMTAVGAFISMLLLSLLIVQALTNKKESQGSL